MNLADPARYWARREPGRVTITFGAREVTWAEFDERTSRLASALVAGGVAPGDRVATLLENCVEFCETVIGAFKAGAVLVPLNHRLAPAELRDIITRSGSTTIVGTADLLRPVAAAGMDPVRNVLVVGPPDAKLASAYEDVLAAHPAVDPDVELTDNHPAVICFTSGTTGLPKGAVLSHRNVMATVTERVLGDDWHRSEVGFIPYAIAFTAGLVCMWLPLYVLGAKTILEPSFEPGRALDIIATRGVTAFIAVPAVLTAMAAHPDFATTDLRGLGTLATGGSRISTELVETYRAAGIGLSQQYGLTEGGGLDLLLPGDEALTRIGSCGRALVHSRARVVDSAGADCPPGEVGELLIRGPQVMEGYWDDPEETARTIVDGWLHTGDLATMDAEGYVRIVDRKKDMLISGGLNVYPAEIERVIDELPEIDEVAVVGVPDDRWGEVPAAIIVRRDASLSGAAVIAACSARLGRYKVPKHVHFRDTPLPRGMSGKVLKRELRAEYGDRA